MLEEFIKMLAETQKELEDQQKEEEESQQVKIFDWIKAAKILRNFKGLTEAKAGLREDWAWTSGVILRGGIPIRASNRPMQLVSSHATPVLRLTKLHGKDEEYSCYTMYNEKEHKNVNAVWPEEALRIFKNADYKYGCLRTASSECRVKSFTEPGLCPSCKKPLVNFRSGQFDNTLKIEDDEFKTDPRKAAAYFMLRARLHSHAGDSSEKKELREKIELHLSTLAKHLHRKLESNLCPEHLQAILNSIRATLDTVNGVRIPRSMGVFETNGLKHTLSITSERTGAK